MRKVILNRMNSRVSMHGKMDQQINNSNVVTFTEITEVIKRP